MRRHNKSSIILVIIFCILSLLPIADMLFKLDRFPHLRENRELSPLPVFRLGCAAIVSFPGAFQAYFNDHFGFRNALIRFNYLIKQKLLGVSPSTQVNIGKQGWLYYNAEGSVEDYRGISHLDEDKLQRLCFTFDLKRKWLELQGIKYLLVIVPNKETIYPEYFPNLLYRRIRDKTILDDFFEYFNKTFKCRYCRSEGSTDKGEKREPSFP